MADDTQRDIENIEKATRNLSRELSKAKKEITESAKETNVWLNATDAVKKAQAGINSMLQFQRNAGAQILKNRQEHDRYLKEEIPAQSEIWNALEGQKTVNDQLAAAERAKSTDSSLTDNQREMARIKALQLDAKSADILKQQEKAAKRIDDIHNKILKKLDAETVALRDQIAKSRDLIKIQKEREMTARKIAVITEGIIKPLSKESAELSKISNAMFNIGKNVALAMAGDPKAILELAKEVGMLAMDRWIELQKASGEFLKNTGLLVTQSKEFDKAAREINNQMQYLGVSLKDAYATAESLYKSFGTTALITRDMMFSSAKLAANLGLANEDVANFKSTFDSISKSTGSTSDDMIKASVALAKMGGVAPSLVLKDMANASGTTLTFLAKSPIQLAKAAVEARRLGTNIEKIASSARGLLNYQESMTDELQASALIGRSISFQNARQLAFEGKIVESRKAALEQIKLAGDFTELTVYQQEALAKAAGMTVEEITKQQNQEKMLAALKNSTNEKDRKTAAAYDNMMQSIAENENKAKNDLVARGREMANQQLRQTQLNKITNAFSAIWTEMTDQFVDLADALMPIVQILSWTALFITKLAGLLVRLIISPITFIVSLFRRIMDIFDDPDMNLGEKILGGIIAIGPALYDALLAPFVSVWDWLAGHFIANSPSELGLGIVDGIKSIGSMLIDSLLAPWKAAWNLIKKIPFVGSLFGNQDSTATIQSEIQKTITASVEIVNMDELSDNIASLNAAIDRLAKATSVGSVINTLTGNNSNSGVEEKLDKLTSLLTGGAVRTFLNGRDVSGTLANNSGR